MTLGICDDRLHAMPLTRVGEGRARTTGAKVDDRTIQTEYVDHERGRIAYDRHRSKQ